MRFYFSPSSDLLQSDEQPAVPQPHHDPTGVLPDVRSRHILRGQRQTFAALQPPVRGLGVPPWRENLQSKVEHLFVVGFSNFSDLDGSQTHPFPDFFFFSPPEVVPQSAAHPSGLGRWTGSRFTALFPECHPSGGVHQRSLHGGGHR